MFFDSYLPIFGVEIFIPAYAKQLLLSALLGFVIGLEREWRGKAASLRTFTTIAAGSCLFTILSIEAAGGQNAAPYDVTRIAAQIVTGIGFLGGGVIFKTSDKIEGITTGAFIWFAAALGMACGFNKIDIVFWAFGIGGFMQLVTMIFYKVFDASSKTSKT